MRATIGKTYTFDAAHQLVGHLGKCANLHGHTYSVTVEVEGEIRETWGSDHGMVIDYTDLDRMIKPLIEAMDHSFLSEGNEIARPASGKVFELKVRSTAENIATFILTWFCTEFRRDHVFSSFRVDSYDVAVTVSETPKTFATVRGQVVV